MGSPPTHWEGALAFTSFSRKVALESEKDIDRAGGLSPSSGAGAPRREQDRAAALHTGSHLHAWPRPTPGSHGAPFPLSGLPPPFPPPFSLLPPPSLPLSLSLPFSPPLSLSPSLFAFQPSFLHFRLFPPLRSLFSVYLGACHCPSIHISRLSSLTAPPHHLLFLNPLPRKGRGSGAPTAADRRAGVAEGLPGLRSFRRKAPLPSDTCSVRPERKAPRSQRRLRPVLSRGKDRKGRMLVYGSVAPVSSAPSGFRGSSVHPPVPGPDPVAPMGSNWRHPSGDAPARHPGRLYCHSSLPGSGSRGTQLAQAESEARRLLPAGCSAPWACSPRGRGRTRPPGGGTRGPPVGRQGSGPASRRRCPG